MLAALVLYFFVPHLSNNHRAKFLHPILIGVTVLTFLLGQVVMSFLPRYTPVVLAYVSNITPEKVIELTNKERVQVGLPEVTLDPTLTQAALAKASYMFAKNYWAHTAPDGTEPWKFVTDSGYQYRYAGENLARDFATPEAAVAAWMASPTHKENLLSPKYQDIGVAVVRGQLNGTETTLIVQFFGTKMASAATAQKPNAKVTKTAIQPEAQKFDTAKIAGAETKGFSISPFKVTKNLAFFIVSIFFFILSLDMVLVKHHNTPRSSSKSFAHMIFFSMIMIVIFISQAGIIL
jgi:hypothetical protein